MKKGSLLLTYSKDEFQGKGFSFERGFAVKQVRSDFCQLCIMFYLFACRVFFCFFVFVFVLLFRATPTAHGGSRARV